MIGFTGDNLNQIYKVENYNATVFNISYDKGKIVGMIDVASKQATKIPPTPMSFCKKMLHKIMRTRTYDYELQCRK